MSTSGRSMDADELKALGERIGQRWRDVMIEELNAAGAAPAADALALIVLSAAAAIAGSYVKLFRPLGGAKMSNRELREFGAGLLARFLPEAGNAPH